MKKQITHNKVFSLYGEKFNIKWLLIYGFWRIIYFGIIAKFGIISVNEKEVNGIFISYGTPEPLPDLWEKGYSVRLIGYILFEPILKYSNEFGHHSNWKFCPGCGKTWENDSESFGCWSCGFMKQ